MQQRFWTTVSDNNAPLVLAICLAISFPASARAGAVTGQATEWTQLLNNGQLISLAGKSAQQVNNQITQIAQLAEQIQNQLNIYRNMLQNTARLPEHVWGQAQQDLSRLRRVVAQGQSIAFSMGNLDDLLNQRFQSFSQFKTELPDGASFSKTYEAWSATNRDTIAGTLGAAELTSNDFASEEGTLSSLRTMSETADGQMKALQVGHQIAAQQVSQVQKLRGLVAQQTTLMGVWMRAEQAKKDLSQARREHFFDFAEPSVRGGQEMRPRW